MGLVAIAWPASEPERAAMVCLLQANDIPCFVHGAGLAAMIPGMQIASYNAPTIMVPESAAGHAAELLSVFAIPAPVDARIGPIRFLARVRMVLELLMFGRFVAQPRALTDDNPHDGPGN